MLEDEGGTGCALGPAGAGARPAWELTWSPRPCPAGCARRWRVSGARRGRRSGSPTWPAAR